MSKRIPIRVPQSMKEEWDEHVETETLEGESTEKYSNRSEFIKYAVNQQIKRDNGEVADAETTTQEQGGNAEQFSKLVETVERMSNRIETLENSVENATRTMNSSGGVTEETTTQVWKALPTQPEQATTAEGIAEGLNADSSTVRVALEQLHETTPSVEKRELQEIEGDTPTVEDHTGKEVEVGGSEGFKRRNPLWWRRE